MTRVSFRRPSSRVYPPVRSLILAGACAASAVAGLAACGGGSTKPAGEQAVRGSGYVFRAPADWNVTRHDRTAAVAPKPNSPELVSVSVFPTAKPYKPELFQKAIPEIDRVARNYAARLGGTVTGSSTVSLVRREVRPFR